MLYADCVLDLHDALIILATTGDSATVERCLIKLLPLDSANPRLDVLNLFLVAGTGVDGLLSIMVLSLVLSSAQIVEIMAVFANRVLSPRLSANPVQVWKAVFQLY